MSSLVYYSCSKKEEKRQYYNAIGEGYFSGHTEEIKSPEIFKENLNLIYIT